jgi:hypothetical protein
VSEARTLPDARSVVIGSGRAGTENGAPVLVRE